MFLAHTTHCRNLNADAAAMPSLGNQYFAFGGSLPELSLTSLTRLLPNSSANDPGMSSCPGLFTLPLYVYPSQQHLATPFINTHGSISFGSFLSSGSSLCSTSKGPVGGSVGSNVSTETPQSGDSNASSGAAGDDKADGCGQVSASATLLPESVIKLPMYSSSPSSTLLGGGASSGRESTSVITSLPGFGMLARGMEPSSMDVSTSNHSIASITSSHSGHPASSLIASSSPRVVNHSSLTSTLGLSGEAANSLQLHPQGGSAGKHGPRPVHPHHLPIHHSQTRTPDNSPTVHSDLYMRGSRDASVLPVGRIKMERDLESPLDPSPAHGLPIMSPEAMHSPHSGANRMAAGNGKVVKKEKEKPYKCDHPGCGRSFSFPAHLRSHIQQIHISYRPCKCEFPGCGKRFYTPQHLNVHRRVHTGERPFVCPYSECSKAFTTAGNLKNHIRTHTGERPYACKFEGCSKRFAEMSSLKKHELTHTGEKPYKCRVCGKAFSQAGSRNTHERKHSRTAAMAEEVSMGDDGTASGGVGSSKKYRIKRISGSGSADEPMQQ